MTDMTRNLLILSAEVAGKRDEHNRQRTECLRHCLEDLQLHFCNAEGFYKGVSEESFVVFLPEVNGEDYAEYDIIHDAVLDFAFKNFDQESVLYQEDGEAWLIVDDNGTRSSQHIGELFQVNPKEIERLDNYTIVGGRVYTTQK
jgi:hypothetical protein